MSRTRRNFSAKFKSELVIELLKGEKDLNTIATENNIQPNLLRNWKKEFLDKTSVVFDDTREDNLKEKLALERKEKAENAKKSRPAIRRLTLPTAKAGGFLFLPPLHWQIPYGTAMSYTVSTGYIYTVPACPAVQFSYLYADCSCSPFFKILMPAFVSRS